MRPAQRMVSLCGMQGLQYPWGSTGSGQNLTGFSQTVFNATSCRGNGAEADRSAFGPVEPMVEIFVLIIFV